MTIILTVDDRQPIVCNMKLKTVMIIHRFGTCFIFCLILKYHENRMKF